MHQSRDGGGPLRAEAVGLRGAAGGEDLAEGGVAGGAGDRPGPVGPGEDIVVGTGYGGDRLRLIIGGTCPFGTRYRLHGTVYTGGGALGLSQDGQSVEFSIVFPELALSCVICSMNFEGSSGVTAIQREWPARRCSTNTTGFSQLVPHWSHIRNDFRSRREPSRTSPIS